MYGYDQCVEPSNNSSRVLSVIWYWAEDIDKLRLEGNSGLRWPRVKDSMPLKARLRSYDTFAS